MSVFLLGQNKKITLHIVFNDSLSLNAEKLVNYSKFIPVANLKNELLSINKQLFQMAYIEASLDSIIINDSLYKCFYHIGKQYKWTHLKKGNIDEEVLSKIGFREKVFYNKPFNQNQLKKFFERIILHYEKNGYPFASVKLDSISFNDNRIEATLNLSKNTFYKIDSVLVKGNAQISDRYIQNYIKIKPGDIYNEELVSQISNRIKELPFVFEKKPFKVQFTKKETKVLLFLNKKKASKFDGILGVLPDDNTGKIQLTGDVKLNLVNAFKKGEKIDFNWRSLQQQTQDLKFGLSYPFIFNTPFGVDYNLSLYKKDTTFVSINNIIGLRYILKGNNYIKVFYDNFSSRLLSQNGFEFLTVLPSYADVSSNLFGLEIFTEKLDYNLNPRKGFNILISGSAGEKKIKQNIKINPKLYENINLKSNIYNAKLNASFFIPIRLRSTIKIGTQTAFKENENLFENELFRIGGLKTLRGFDEESIFASFYSINTLEYRFILEQNSYIYVFFDGAYYEKKTLENYLSDRPFGFGSGISFQTRAGIFSISYALGKQFNNPILFRSAKVHFGFVNFF